MKIGQESRHDANSAPVVRTLATVLPSIRLPSPAITAASSGRKTMRRINELPLHPVDVVDRNRAASAEIDDQYGKPDRRLARRDRQHEHREHLADQIMEIGRE